MNAPVSSDGLGMARSIEAIALAEAAPSEAGRTLTQPLVEALWESGLMQWMNPADAGGSEPGFAELIETWVELARQDGSLGWIGIANFPSASFAAAYLPQAGFDEVFAAQGNRGNEQRPKQQIHCVSVAVVWGRHRAACEAMLRVCADQREDLDVAMHGEDAPLRVVARAREGDGEG